MIVKVLGTGCKKCQNLENKVKEIIASNDIKAEVEKVQEIADIMKYNVMMTPALVVNEKVVSTGVIPNEDEILNWLKEN